VNDLKFTVNHAVEPINEKLHMISQNIKKHEKGKKKTNDDSCINSPTSLNRVISGIDDPLLNGSLTTVVRRKCEGIAGNQGTRVQRVAERAVIMA